MSWIASPNGRSRIVFHCKVARSASTTQWRRAIPRIASAAAVFFNCYGDVSHYARHRGVCRHLVYREAHWMRTRFDSTAGLRELEDLCPRLGHL
jgi:hypothetical protein